MAFRRKPADVDLTSEKLDELQRKLNEIVEATAEATLVLERTRRAMTDLNKAIKRSENERRLQYGGGGHK